MDLDLEPDLEPELEPVVGAGAGFRPGRVGFAGGGELLLL